MSNSKIPVTIDIDLEDLIPGFLTNRGKDLGTLRNALECSDFPVMQSIGHSLKGVGGGYGFDRMSEIGAAIENAARIKNVEQLKELIENYSDYLTRVEVRFE
ncbi:MAG: hypothetical protein A3I78_01260 [Gammaproteobacteria bacterium RIFCSPLOWO2_02_FULL_56_15]|nr:MAG: hypothetical protein A3I78_01260 [Gammaproteobacteria bacterium RIFCSPLOWO2_02_FULL_56_15]